MTQEETQEALWRAQAEFDAIWAARGSSQYMGKDNGAEYGIDHRPAGRCFKARPRADIDILEFAAGNSAIRTKEPL